MTMNLYITIDISLLKSYWKQTQNDPQILLVLLSHPSVILQDANSHYLLQLATSSVEYPKNKQNKNVILNI